MATGRYNDTATLLSNGKVLVTGGADPSGSPLSSAELYDPASNTWTREPNLPTPRHGLGAAVVGDRWYIVGGATSSGPFTQRTFTPVVDIWVPNA